MNSRNPYDTPLTPENAALVLVDHQSGLMSFVPSTEAMLLKNNIIALGKIGKRFKLPTILTTSWPDGPNGPTIPELREMYPDNEIIDRDTVKFWDHKPSVEAVKKTGRPKLIMAAIDTTTCLSFAAIYGVQNGYDVYAVIDASSTFTSRDEHVAITRMAHAGVVVTTWVPVLAELANNTMKNGVHIADLLAAHTGTYSAAWTNYMETAKSAPVVKQYLDEARKAAGIDPVRGW
jgi:nicotinamidase-related amidase